MRLSFCGGGCTENVKNEEDSVVFETAGWTPWKHHVQQDRKQEFNFKCFLCNHEYIKNKA